MATTVSSTIGQKENSFFRNTLTLVGGNMVARIITFGLAPLVTRLYPPEVFGAFSLIIAVAEVFVAVSCLRYNNTILLPEKHEDADNLIALCFFLVVSTSIISLGFVSWFPLFFSQKLGLGNQTLLFFIPAVVLVAGVQQITDMWFLRLKFFNRLAFSKVTGATTDRALSIYIGLFVAGNPAGLLSGKIAGLSSSMVTLFFADTQPIKTIITNFSFERMKLLARRYIIFPKFVGDAFVQRASVQAPLLLLGAFFSPAVVGLYALAQRILGEPMTLVGDSLGRSFSQKASEHFRNGENLAHNTMRLYRYILSLFVAPMVILSFVLADLFGLIFGAEWQEAGSYVKLIMPVFIAVFAIRPMSIYYDLYEKQKERTIHNSITLVIICCSFTAGFAAGNSKLALVLYAVSVSVVTLLRTGWLMELTGTSWRDFWQATQRGLLWPLCIVGSVLVLQNSPWSRYLIIYCLTTTLIYLSVIIWNDEILSKQCKDYYHDVISRS
nr:lipopolysaccharide biosynthesis protein [Desulfobulbaceae bacterium]